MRIAVESLGGIPEEIDQMSNLIEHRVTLLFLFVSLAFLSGCVSHSRTAQVPNSGIVKSGRMLTGYPCHIVSKGETLWRICQNYGVDIEEVIRLNKISDPSRIEVGQKIFLPVRSGEKHPVVKVGSRYSGPTEKNFIWPVRGRISLFYGQCRDGWVNKGIEVIASKKTVVSPKTGKVILISDHLKGYGVTIMIDHGDGFISVIAGNGRGLVVLGQVVSQGEEIMTVPVGEKVHFEIRKNAKAVNPLRYLD